MSVKPPAVCLGEAKEGGGTYSRDIIVLDGLLPSCWVHRDG